MWGVDWVQLWAFWHTVGGLIVGVAVLVLVVLGALVVALVTDLRWRWQHRRRR